MMAKQTFTTGQVLTAAQMTSLQQTAMLGGDASAKVASYVLAAADAGTAISMSNGSATTITVNTGLFAAGDIVTIINLGAGVCTITAGTATVTTSGSLALAQNQGGVLRFTSASAAIFFQFATPASGDIEGVTAGTGISGGGSSGTVTITNSMATEIDAKGDLIVGTGADTFARLAVGTNGYTLVADSSVSPTGLKWAAPAGGGSWSQAATGSLSSSTTSITSLSGKAYLLILDGYSGTNDTDLRIGVNNSAAVIQSALDTGKTNTFVTMGAANLPAANLGYTTVFFDLADTSAQAKPIIGSYGGIVGARMVNAWTTSAITSIDISTSGGTWDAGTYYVWSFA